MNLILFDDHEIRLSLLPFTFMRPVSAIRLGIFTLAEKWEKHLGATPSYLTDDYLSSKFPMHVSDPNYLVNGALIAHSTLAEAIKRLNPGEVLVKEDLLLAQCCDRMTLLKLETTPFKPEQVIHFEGEVTMLKNPWEIFALNGAEIRADFELIKNQSESKTITDAHTVVYGKENLFIEEGVKIRAAILNAEDGPIYLGKNSEVKEGAIIKGPFALCEESVVNMGAKMRPDTTIGPYCKVGGEISNSVFFGYSNKSHEGFLGNSVIAEWCNLGADTNNSNLKNNYSTVKIWSYAQNRYVDTARQFCGLFMGDHSKSGINTMFNTGTVVGVSTNVFGGGFPPKFIGSFSWGGSEGMDVYEFNKALETASNAMGRRNVKFSKADRQIFKYLYDLPKERLGLET